MCDPRVGLYQHTWFRLSVPRQPTPNFQNVQSRTYRGILSTRHRLRSVRDANKPICMALLVCVVLRSIACP